MTREPRFTAVGPAGAVPAGQMREFVVDGLEIVVVNLDGELHAFGNRCPHQGGPLCLGHVLGDAVADTPGEARISADPLRIACPWHGWEYDLDSGQSFMGGAMAGVRSYGVGLERGGSLLEEATARPAERVPGPYVAETFEVSIEDEYVVLNA